ncbi:subclass B3 metallo-beta-lactamase [Qipengyuania sp. GH1]|nr:subclass B3 metallo-beta-lactamase [Qipengyuania aestuarii]
MSAKYLISLALSISLAGCMGAVLAEKEDMNTAISREPALDPVDLKQQRLAFLDTCEAWDDWAKPSPPFQLIGNSFYVGTCGISAVLVTSDDGHVLIDSGVPEAAPLVLANIRRLGFHPRDVRFILMSHEHFDHVGAHAALAEATGAQIVASPQAEAVLQSGLAAADDPQAEMDHPAMTPVEVGQILSDGEVLRLGELEFTAHATPGHTPGAMSWTWNSCSLASEPRACSRMAYVDSLSAVSSDDYRLSDHPAYLAAFRDSIEKVRLLPCDFIVTPHPSASQLLKNLRSGTFGAPGQCETYAASLSAKLDARLAKEADE